MHKCPLRYYGICGSWIHYVYNLLEKKNVFFSLQKCLIMSENVDVNADINVDIH